MLENREYEVAVCGGGFAGIAAALSAARRMKSLGKDVSVMLLENSFMLGGLATAGLVTIYLPICDGKGNQVCYGITDELFWLSIKHGIEAQEPTPWLNDASKEDRARKRLMVQYNAQLFALEAERLLISEGVKIVYGARAVGTKVEDGVITHVMIEGKGGREAIAVGSVVDSTGDADICLFAGAKTSNFSEGNKLAAWYYGYGNGQFNLYMCGVHDIPDEENNIEIINNTRWSGLDTMELSELTEVSHGALLQNFVERRKTIPDLVPTTIATIPEVRMTRRLVGKTELELFDRAYCEESVGLFPNWRKHGPVYELPFSSLYGTEVKNLITAGRCISTTEPTWDITRVIPVCAVTGEAAGAAAAECRDFDKINIKSLQDYLRSAGVKLHCEEIEK